MTPTLQIIDDLGSHLVLCQEICAQVERESQLLRNGDDQSALLAFRKKRELLAELQTSLNRIREDRNIWRRLSRSERAVYSKVPELIRANQDLIMKIIVLDRENEQVLLRKGLGRKFPAPVSSPPPQPHYVAGLYERNAGLTGSIPAPSEGETGNNS